jgi:hypothetical protein
MRSIGLALLLGGALFLGCSAFGASDDVPAVAAPTEAGTLPDGQIADGGTSGPDAALLVDANAGDGDAGASRVVFVSINTSNGRMGFGGGLQGLVGADTECNAEAAAAGLAGVYVAWLSTDTTNAIERLPAGTSWTLRGGDRVFASKEAIVGAPPLKAITEGPGGVAVSPGGKLWTGTLPSGLKATARCGQGFDQANPGTFGRTGTVGATTTEWTDDLSSPACAGTFRILCFGI